MKLKFFFLLILSSYGFNISTIIKSKAETNDSFDRLFKDYLSISNKTYENSGEFIFRKKVFENNLSKLLFDFNRLDQKYRIIEEVQDNNKVKRIILDNKDKSCGCELALNDFIAMTDNEFKNGHLLPPVFFDTNLYKPKNTIFEASAYYPGTSFHGHSNWISDNLNRLVNDPNFDIFRETLLKRQNPQKTKKYQNITYESHFIKNNFQKFTLHDLNKADDQTYDFLFNSMPSYDFNTKGMNMSVFDDDDEVFCKQGLNKSEGRKLQSYYDNNYSGFGNLDNNYWGSNNSQNFDNFSTNNWFGNNDWYNNFDKQNKKTAKSSGIWGDDSQWTNNSNVLNNVNLFNESSKKTQAKNIKNKSFDDLSMYDPWGSFKSSSSQTQATDPWKTSIPTPTQKPVDPWGSFNSSTSTSSEKSKTNSAGKKEITLNGVKIPTYLNWQEQRSFTPVKDQKDCNACYAFGAISGLEAHNVLKNNNYTTYSEQEILDCSNVNKACVGGQPFMVYDYIKENGIYQSKDYPYFAKKMRCKSPKAEKFNKLKGYIFTKKGIKNLLIALTFGPVVVVSYASDHLKYYYKGVYKGEGCDGVQLPNHSSLLYGYNLNVPRPYLMFKNGWGSVWGNGGYYKVEIGDLNDDSNMGYCLIANTPYNTMPLL